MKQFTLTLVVSLLTSYSWAGPKGPLPPPGNEGPYGGGGVVCGKKLISAQILDLWEAEAFKKLPVTYNESPVKEQMLNALDKYLRINGMLPQEITDTAMKLYESVAIKSENGVPEGLEITPPSDVLSPFVPTPDSTCFFKGIAAYDDISQTLFVDYALYSALRSTDRAALFIHEAFYKYLRDHYRVKNSIAARNITACLFADQACKELSPLYEIPESGPLYKCHPEGWLESVTNEPAFDSDDYRMSEPHFYLFPSTKEDKSDKKISFWTWRFQLVALKSKASLKASGFEWVTVPTRSFFDVKMSEQSELEILSNQFVISYAFNDKGVMDMLMNTFSADKDPWKMALGPRFSYRLTRKEVSSGIGQTYIEMNGFPLSCEKIR